MMQPGSLALRRAGFSLIELLVVVAIIALLAAVLLPSMARARQQAQAAVCLANLHRLGHAVMFYTESYRVYPPFRLKKVLGASGWVDFVNRYGRKAPRWQWFFDYGVGPVIDAGGVAAGSDTMTNELFLCPSLRDQHERNIRNGAYGYNYQYLGNSRETAGTRQHERWPVSAGLIKSPARTVVLGDSRGAGLPHGPHSYSLDPPRLATEAGATKFGPETSDAPSGRPELAYSPLERRHGRRGNVVMADGHASAFEPARLGYLVRPEDGLILPGEAGTASNAMWTGRGAESSAGDAAAVR